MKPENYNDLGFCCPKSSLEIEPIVDDTILIDGAQMPDITVSPEHMIQSPVLTALWLKG